MADQDLALDGEILPLDDHEEPVEFKKDLQSTRGSDMIADRLKEEDKLVDRLKHDPDEDMTKVLEDSTANSSPQKKEQDMIGKLVWCPHDSLVWSQVTVVSYEEEGGRFVVASSEDPSLTKYIPVEKVYPVDPTHLLNLSDLCEMNDLHEAPLLNVLRRRYFQKEIYTYTGDVLISVNPYEFIPGLYDSANEYFYADKFHIFASSSKSKDGAHDPLFPSPAGALTSYHHNARHSAPHVYGIASEALQQLNESINAGSQAQFDEERLQNQSVIISGESGAGKTENAKVVLNFLIYANNQLMDAISHVGQQRSKSRRKSTFEKSLKMVLLQSGVILESFGNAKTIRNDNSSRFGKYIKLLYTSQSVPSQQSEVDGSMVPILSSAITETFLLEKSRLTYVGGGERSYHIFYQLYAGLSEPSKIELQKILCLHHPIDEFKIMMQGGYGVIAQDLTDFNAIETALATLQCSETERWETWKLLASILHMSNIQCLGRNKSEAPMTFREDTVDLSCPTVSFETLAEWLGMPWCALKTALTNQQIKVGNRSSIKIKVLSPGEVLNNIGALSKWLYSKLFDWLVKKINYSHHHLTGQGDPTLNKPFTLSSNFIGILDIFGFEIMQVNSFEQLCINFTNERLQKQFNEHVFSAEQRIYRTEGLSWNNISFRDNQPILDVISSSKAPLGLLLVLEEHGMLNRKPDDLALLNAFNLIHDSSTAPASSGSNSNSPTNKPVVSNKSSIVKATVPKGTASTSIYVKSRFNVGSFTLRHFAGEVNYAIQGFLSKNNDSLQDDLMRVFYTTSNTFLHNVMQFGDPLPDEPGYLALDETVNATNNVNTSGNKRMASSTTISLKFRQQLDNLMTTLQSTNPHYIKCIKPNSHKALELFESKLVIEQLRYSGVLEVVRIRREGFPIRVTFPTFIKEYKILLRGKTHLFFPDPLNCSFEEVKHCAVWMAGQCLSVNDYQAGHSLLFLRQNGHQLMQEAIQRYFDAKAAVIQSRMRGILARRYCFKLFFSIIQMQAAIRMFISKFRYQSISGASRVIQRFYLTKHIRRQFVRRYTALTEARRLALLKKQFQAAQKIQSLIRGQLQCRRYQVQYISIIIIQTSLRGYSTRRYYKELRNRHAMAVKLQTWIRCSLFSRQYVRTRREVVRLQAFLRRFRATRKLRRQIEAIVLLQSIWRMNRLFNKYHSFMESLCRLQATFRTRCQRQQFMCIIQMTKKLQAWVRCKQEQQRYLMIKSALLLLQSVVRGYQVRQLYLRSIEAVIRLQSRYRSHCMTKRYRSLQNAVMTVQRFTRGFLMRLGYGEVRCHILTIQSWARMVIAMRRYHTSILSAITLQTFLRCKLQQRFYQRYRHSIIRLQSAVRSHRDRLRYLQSCGKIIRLQSFGRMIDARRRYQQTLMAIIQIQAQQRKHSQHVHYQLSRNSVLHIQTWWRCYHNRDAYHRTRVLIIRLQTFGRKLQHQRRYELVLFSVVMMQTTWRRYALRTDYLNHRQACIRIQTWYRQQATRIWFLHRLHAIIKLQSFVRCSQAMNRLHFAIFSATVLQSQYRRFVCYRGYSRLRSAAVLAQTHFRGFAKRWRFLDLRWAAVKAQTVFRRWRDQAKFFLALWAERRIKIAMRSHHRNQALARRLHRLHGYGDTPLPSSIPIYSAINEAYNQITSHLKKYPEDSNIRWHGFKGRSLLHSLLLQGRVDLIRLLDFTPADLLETDYLGRSSIHYVALGSNHSCLLALAHLINTYQHHQRTEMIALDEDKDDDNDHDDGADDNKRQEMKAALAQSVNTSSLKTGWLKKKRGGMMWQKRWVVLTEDYIVYYRNNNVTTSAPKFAIPLQDCTVQRQTGTREPIFEIFSPVMQEKRSLFGGAGKKSMCFMAESEKELQEWLLPLKATTGVSSLRSANQRQIQYINTEMRQLWLNSRDHDGNTALHFLALRWPGVMTPQPEQRRRLSLSLQNVTKRTSVHILSQKKKVEDVTIALRYANAVEIAAQGVVAGAEDLVPMLTWLVEFGCDLKTCNKVGHNAMHLAVHFGAEQKIVSSLFIKCPEILQLQDEEGRDALDYALQSNRQDMRNLLAQITRTYTSVATARVKGVSQPVPTLIERNNFKLKDKLKGYSYLSLYFGQQQFHQMRSDLSETVVLTVSVMNAKRQLLEDSKQLKWPSLAGYFSSDVESLSSQSLDSHGSTTPGETPRTHRHPSKSTAALSKEMPTGGLQTGNCLYWGLTWHMQTPLENIESGCSILLEYRSTSQANLQTCSMALDVETIDSKPLTLSLSTANGEDRSYLLSDVVVTTRDRPVQLVDVLENK